MKKIVDFLQSAKDRWELATWLGAIFLSLYIGLQNLTQQSSLRHQIDEILDVPIGKTLLFALGSFLLLSGWLSLMSRRHRKQLSKRNIPESYIGPIIEHAKVKWGTTLHVVSTSLHTISVTDPLCFDCKTPIFCKFGMGDCPKESCRAMYDLKPRVEVVKKGAQKDATGRYLRGELEFPVAPPNPHLSPLLPKG